MENSDQATTRLEHILNKLPPLAIGHCVASVACLLYMLFPFIDYWEYNIESMAFTLRQGKGSLGLNAIISVAFGSFGMIVGGYWWRVMRFLKPSDAWLRYVFLIPLLVVLIYNYITLFEWGDTIEPLRGWYYGVGLGTLLVSFLVHFFRRESSIKLKISAQQFKEWVSRKDSLNWFFYGVVTLTLIFNNVAVLNQLELQWSSYISALAGRVAFQLALVSLLWLLIECMLRATPKILRWSIWSVYGCLVIVAIVDTVTHTMMNRPLLAYINGFTQTGDFNWRQELKGAGEELKWFAEMDIWQAVVIVALFFIATSCFALFCSYISRLKKWVSLKRVSYIFGASLVLLVVEQGLGMAWKGNADRKKEWQAFDLKIPIFAPPVGVANYSIDFVMDEASISIDENLTTKPDVYFIMVESMRGDAITEEITPFLHQFKHSEAQQFKHTWAGSNATHLSWFSIFHSRPPVHWGYTVENQNNNPETKGSPTIKWLKANGYNIEIRAVCDLGYMFFGETNFGDVGQIVDVTDQCVKGHRYYDIDGGIPEREKVVFKDTLDACSENPEGGNFYFVALDSPHYGYYWPHDFDPLFDDYLESQNELPVSASAEEVLAYKKRYWNACNWVDHQVKEFISDLKEAGRYDNSIIVVTGDHGEEFKEHGSFFHCSNLFPEQTGVPILIKWPKDTESPSLENASHLDIMPSILSYLGASQGTLDQLHGRSTLQAREDNTSIITTNYAGTNGQTMMLRNKDYTAAFAWQYYWTGNVPKELALVNIKKAGKEIHSNDPKESLVQLKKCFPDVFERLIIDLKVCE